MGLSDKTIRSSLDILTRTFMVRQLQPSVGNTGKRQLKKPKIYFCDTGLLHSLLDIKKYYALLGNPKVGASWEGFALEQVLQIHHPSQAYYWGTYNQAELDLLIIHNGRRYGVEGKFSEAPKITPSMRSALRELGLSHLWVIYPGQHNYPAGENISLWSLQDISKLPL
jgi:uncharacterized protein